MSRLQLEAGDRIDLAIGQPDMRLLPLDELRRSAEDRLSRIGETEILQYGPAEGSAPFRALLARFLTEGYGVSVLPERLFTTNGASHGLDLILSRFTREGDVVFVEEPTYFHALKIIRSRRLEIVPVPVDDQGIDVQALEARLQEVTPKLLYTIPVHHNPKGVTLPADRREKLVALAKKHDFLIAADEVYQLLTYEGTVPRPLGTFDEERVLSISSFSKILAPGLRFGWIDGAPHLLDALGDCGVLESGGGASPLTAAILESAMELGLLDRYLTGLKATYRRRARALIDALRAHLDPRIRFVEPTGGFFVWLELPRGADSAALVEKARAAKAGFLPGSIASVDGDQASCLRLCFTYFDEQELRTAIERIAPILHSA